MNLLVQNCETHKVTVLMMILIENYNKVLGNYCWEFCNIYTKHNRSDYSYNVEEQLEGLPCCPGHC